MFSIFPIYCMFNYCDASFPAELCVVRQLKNNVCELDEDNYSREFACFCSFTYYETIFLAEICVGLRETLVSKM